MHPIRAQFGQHVANPVGLPSEGQKGLKRSHMVVLAALGFVAVAGGISSIGGGTQPQGVDAQTADASTPSTLDQPSSGGRSWFIMAIPFFSRSAAPAPAAAAQANVQRGGFGETSRTMASGSSRGTAGG